jgi:MFS family permease
MGAMLLSVVLVIAFGQGQADLQSLSLVAAAAGFCTNAGVVGLYAIIARSFPTRLRATATGVVIGVGRGGSALAPAVAGLLFTAGYGLSAVAMLMSLGSAIAVVALIGMRRQQAAAD